MDHEDRHTEPNASGNGRSKIVFAVMLAVAAFYLLSEHRAHVLGYLPYLLFLACPLMHLFHHDGHGGHGGHGQPPPRADETAARGLKEHRS